MTDQIKTTSRLPYLLILPGLIVGWAAVGILAPLGIGIFGEEILRIHDAAFWLPEMLFFPLGLVGIAAGAVVGFLFAREAINHG